MKVHRLFIAFISVLLLNFYTAYIVRADVLDDLGQIVDGSLLTDKTEVEDTVMKLTRGNILNKGTTKCTNAGDSKVTVSGLTVAHVVCDKLYLSLSLDQYDSNNKSWSSYEIWSLTKENASIFLDSYTVDVDPGYYYRVRGVHAAEKGETYESVETCTDGIMIN